MDIGKHDIRKPKETTIVRAINEYKRLLEGMSNQRMFPEGCGEEQEGEEQLENLQLNEKSFELKEGFTLQASRTNKRYDPKIIARLKEMYAERERSGTK